jgi:hypothetical protein
MPQTFQQIRERLKSPKKKGIIRRAVSHQERLRFHAQISLDRYTTSQALTEYLEWVKSATEMPEDKFGTFMYMMRFPIKTVPIVGAIKGDLGKVFDGQNPVFKYDFTSSDLAEDHMDYLTEKQIANKWRTDGLDTMIESINSVMIVDFPEMQKGERPEPYSWFLDICHAIDFEDGIDEFEWFQFRKDKETIIHIDEVSYRTFFFESNPDELRLISEVKHDFGYTPAKFFWKEGISRTDPDIKLSPLTTNLGDLDWLLYFMLAKQHLDTYAGYPIYSAYERDCDYEYEGERGFVRCDRGFLKDIAGHYFQQGDRMAVCPVCSQKRLRGPGTFFEIPKPGPENDNADMRNPVQITTIDVKSLKHNVEEVERLKKEIHESIVGASSDPSNEQAMNVKQIMAAFESRTAKLRDLKKNFEIAMEWEAYTLAKGRYGDDFLGCFIDLGTDFYLYESQYLLDLYHTARTAKADSSILDSLQNQYFAARYRNSPDQLQKEMIITHIDPLRHITTEEAAKLHEMNAVGFSDFVVKLNLSTFVNRFERENAPLTKFGSLLPFDKRINTIKSIIYSYVQRPTEKESYIGNPTGAAGSSANGNKPGAAK